MIRAVRFIDNLNGICDPALKHIKDIYTESIDNLMKNKRYDVNTNTTESSTDLTCSNVVREYISEIHPSYDIDTLKRLMSYCWTNLLNIINWYNNLYVKVSSVDTRKTTDIYRIYYTCSSTKGYYNVSFLTAEMLIFNKSCYCENDVSKTLPIISLLNKNQLICDISFIVFCLNTICDESNMLVVDVVPIIMSYVLFTV